MFRSFLILCTNLQYYSLC